MVYLVNVEVLPEEGALLCGCLLAVICQDLSEGQGSIFWLIQGEGLTANGEVNMVLCQRPAPPFVHVHGLRVTAKCMPPLYEEGHRRKE